MLAVLALTLGLALTGSTQANAVSGNNGVLNGYGMGTVGSLGCFGTTMTPVVGIQAGSRTSNIAFRFWLRPTSSAAWSTTPWRSYSTAPGVFYRIPSSWGAYDENIPQRGSGAYYVYVEFQFYSGGAWRGQEFAQIGGIVSTYGVTDYTGWYCWSQQW